ncbi:hypothetical protein QJS10_CPA06g01029 [Acorus calamus]|uniref:DUF4283 domain-containing protein n=1 Tax=Acorus calamus TaxID=4465 RepID=A0AAV9EID6_ACOCL|nr:hypothetical protein QJS10_CPA06g01029 [Acorus calamus]
METLMTLATRGNPWREFLPPKPLHRRSAEEDGDLCVAFIKRLWKIKGDIQLSLQGNGFFMVQFDLQEDVQRVLKGGPWTMDNRPFVLQKWSPSVCMEQERLTTIPIWVKFPNLPLHMWTKELLEKIASAVWTPLFMDTATQMATKISFTRVCVEVEAGKALPDSVVIESKADGREIFPIIYDWKPQACSHYQTFGHDDALCCKRPRLLPQVPKGPSQGISSVREKGSTSQVKNDTKPPRSSPKKSAIYVVKSTIVSNKFEALSEDSRGAKIAKHLQSEPLNKDIPKHREGEMAVSALIHKEVSKKEVASAVPLTKETLTKQMESTTKLPPVQMEVSAEEDSLPKNGVFDVADNAAVQQSAQQEQSITIQQALPLQTSTESLCNLMDNGPKALDKNKSVMLINVKYEARMQTLPHEALASVKIVSAANLFAPRQE